MNEIEIRKKLDKLKDDGELNQEVINEIVLWKIGRYADVTKCSETLKKVEGLRGKKEYANEDIKQLIRTIFAISGLGRIAMASTLLRFVNPNLFQIIDQRMMRIIYGNKDNANNDIYEFCKHLQKDGNLAGNNDKESSVNFYVEKYLPKLHEIYKANNDLQFHEIDRVLWQLDKDKNGKKMSEMPKWAYNEENELVQLTN